MVATTDADRGQQHRDYMRERRRTETRSSQDIGAIPPVVDWARRKACEANAELFLRTYFGFEPYFNLPFCDVHRVAIGKGDQAIRRGGLFALAMWRGGGKTTICRGLSIRALAYGWRRFVFLVSATLGHAELSLDAIKTMIVDSEPFAEDFPEIVYPVRALEGETKRQAGQRCLGERTEIYWGRGHITLPAVPRQESVRPEQHKSGGAKIYISGITGSQVRGFNVRGDRPDLLVADDPQTEDSANSPRGCEKRESILSSMAIGLAGPGKTIAGIMPCTVVRKGDMVDSILDHQKHPEWDSLRMKLMPAFPSNMDLWEKYRDLRFNYDPHAGKEDKARAAEEATLYYADHADAMQLGAVVSWPEDHKEDELDAIQSAMNLYFQDRAKFFAEKQNEPLEVDLGNVVELTPDDVVSRLNGIVRGVVPIEAATLTSFVDVQANLLFWMAIAWKGNFTGWIVDYGVWPEQGRPYFTKADVSMTLARATKLPGEEAQLRQGLAMLLDQLLGRGWPRENGAEVRVDRCLIDSGYQSKVIYEFCRRSPYGGLVHPSKGEFVGAGSKKGVGEGKINPGDRRGLNWILPAAKEERGVRLLRFDSNFYKSFAHARLAVAPNLPESISLFGAEQGVHRMLADHLVAEYRDRVRSERTGREVDEWHPKPGRPDNDWLDCLVGNCVAASMQGTALEGVHQPAKQLDQKKGRTSWAEKQKQAEARRRRAV